MSSEPPTKELDLLDEEQTDPHLRLPSASPPAVEPAPKPLSAMPRRSLGASGSMPAVPSQARTSTLPGAPAPATTPPRPSQPAARPPILPTATRFGPAPTPPVAPTPSIDRTSTLPSEPPSGPILATMLIPRPSSPPPAAGRASDPGTDPLRERLAQLEVHGSATRSIAHRVENDTTRAHVRLDALEPRVSNVESSVREALTRIEHAHEATRQSLELRVTQVELVARTGASAASGAPEPVIAVPSAPVPDAADAAPTRTALATIRQELAEHERKFEARRARIESLESRVAALEVDARLVELRRMTEAFDLRIVAIERAHQSAQQDLERRLAEMEERLAARLTPPAKEPAAKKAAKPASDLARIKGLGPKYQKALAELGITSVAAVATLSDADLVRIATHLATSVDKLKKLGWVEAARALGTE